MSPRDRYNDIADDLRERIKRGDWPPGEKLPRMVDLSTEYDAARGSIARAIRELEEEGIVKSTPHRGTIVLPGRARRRLPRGTHVHRRRPREGGYSFAATQPGEPSWVHHIEPTREPAPITERAAELLGVEPGTMVFRRRRVTSPAGEVPFTVSESWIPPDVVEAAPGVAEQGPPGGYLDHIEAAGHGPLRWHEITRARMPDREEAELLGIPLRLPVLETCRVSESARTGAAVEVTVMVIPSDRVELVSQLRRDRTATYEVLSSPGESIKEP
jgi:GntR family transcriptional regulator